MNKDEDAKPHALCDYAILDQLYEAIGDSITRIIDLFIDDFANSITKLEQALASGDNETLARIAHTLKSTCANVGCMQLSAEAIALEELSKHDPTAKQLLAKHIKQLPVTFALTKPELLEYKSKLPK